MGVFDQPTSDDMVLALAIRLAWAVTGRRDEQTARLWMDDARSIIDQCPPPEGVLHRMEVTRHDPAYIARRLGLAWPIEHDTTAIDYNRNYFMIVEEEDGTASVLTPDAWRERFPSPVPQDSQEQP